jgi:hypothetical protein
LSRSRVIDNAGAAVVDVALVSNSVLGGNASGALDGQTIFGSLIYANGGVGVRQGAVTNSAIVGNEGDGAVDAGTGEALSIDNSWIVDNGGRGVVGQTSTGSASIANSTIFRNAGVGVAERPPGGRRERLRERLGESASPDEGTPTEASVSVSGSGALDYEGNWWGVENNAAIAANAVNFDHPFLTDALDGSGSRRFDVWDPAPAQLAAPDAQPPAFLLDARVFAEASPTPLAPLEQLGVGLATFDLLFSEAMNTSVGLSVTFAIAEAGTRRGATSEPFAEKVVEPVPALVVGAADGWIDDQTWRGTYAVESDTGDGTNRLKVSGALSRATAFSCRTTSGSSSRSTPRAGSRRTSAARTAPASWGACASFGRPKGSWPARAARRKRAASTC